MRRMLLIIFADLDVLGEARRKTKDSRRFVHTWRQKFNCFQLVRILQQTNDHRTINIVICLIKREFNNICRDTNEVSRHVYYIYICTLHVCMRQMQQKMHSWSNLLPSKSLTNSSKPFCLSHTHTSLARRRGISHM